MNTYIQHIRKKLGHDKFIHPAARIIVMNEADQVLFVARNDTGGLGIPAGSLEEGETIEACIMREVEEETGLTLTAAEVIGISSQPEAESVSYPNGDQIQYFTVEFFSRSWTGEIEPRDQEEVAQAMFLDMARKEDLPPNERATFESLAYYRRHQRIRLR